MGPKTIAWSQTAEELFFIYLEPADLVPVHSDLINSILCSVRGLSGFHTVVSSSKLNNSTRLPREIFQLRQCLNPAVYAVRARLFPDLARSDGIFDAATQLLNNLDDFLSPYDPCELINLFITCLGISLRS